MAVSTRAYDRRCEKIVSEFLDKYFYAMYDAKSERMNSKDLQLRGVDVIVDDKMFIDEKLKLYPLNEFIPCLAFELQFFTRDGRLVDGWFLNENSITTHYNIVTAFLNGRKSVLEDVEDIEYLNLLFVKKSAVKEFVFAETSREQLGNDIGALRTREVTESEKMKARHKYAHNKFWLTKSEHLAEKPINLNIPRTSLCKLPHSAEFCVSRYGVQRMANSSSPIVLRLCGDGGLRSADGFVFA